MDISVTRGAALVLICLVLVSACGELETLFPSNGTYQVRTLVNGSPLEDCSIVHSNDKIRPYFAVSVVNDPDLIGLLVYLQDSKGKIVGDKVQYTLLPYAKESALMEDDFQEEAEPNEAGDPVPEAEANNTNKDESQTPPQPSAANVKPIVKNTTIEIAVKSLAAELPYFPLSKNLEIGSYVLVFETLGKKETLSHTETDVFYLGNAEFNLKDIAMYLPGLSGSQLISPETMIMLEASLNFDSRLDPYVIWYNGKTIISEGKIRDGAGKLLWKAPEEAGFYSLRLEAFPFNLKRTMYTGLSREIALPVSPKAVSLGYFFESNEEYTIHSPLSAIMNEETPPELLQWYQFEGSLHDSLSASADEQQALLPVNESKPQWAAAGQSYGLSTGPDDPYLLSPVNFFREKKDQGGGVLLLHIRPLSEGIIFSVFFPLKSSSTEGVWMDLIKKGNVIALHLSAGDTFVDLPVYLTFSTTEDFIPIAVEFYIRPYRLEAKISLNDYLQNKVGGINHPDILSGEGRIRLGGRIDKSTLDKSMLALRNEAALYQEESFEMTITVDSAEEVNAYIPAVVETFSDTVWDELAILFSATPLLSETLLDTIHAANVQQEAVSADTRSAEAGLNDTNDDISVQEERETQERTDL